MILWVGLVVVGVILMVLWVDPLVLEVVLVVPRRVLVVLVTTPRDIC